MKKRFPDIDWYCDRCNAFLNIQTGFNDNKNTWECTECGYVNSISEDAIVSDDYDDYEEYDDDEEYEDDGEGLSVYDAALIWLSHGMDEDYTFGYSEEELEEALR